MTQGRESNSADLITIGLFVALVILGWINIYAAEFDPENIRSIFSISNSSGKQLIWIGSSILIGVFIYVLDYKFFDSFGYLIYLIFIILLIAVLFFGKEVSGARSWFELGAFRFQPSEFAKYATLLALAKYLSEVKQKSFNAKTLFFAGLIIVFPMMLTVLQKDAGTAMVYTSLLLVLYREGMSPVFFALIISSIILFLLSLVIEPIILILAIGAVVLLLIGLLEKTPKVIGWTVISGVLAAGLVISVDFAMNNVFQPHQQKRILSLLNPNDDPLGVGWNVTQSKIAIGSGGLEGKGFLEGTQTKFDFVPEQTTDFIFCTVGEEHGWLGTTSIIVLFVILFIRLINIAERQKTAFSRIFGYGVISVFFFHFMINISMTVGLFPVVGIPLPFFSYGGSSLWAFSLMLFTFLKLDSHRMQMLQR